MRRKECIAVLKESLIPTRWMRAYISIYLIAVLVQMATAVLVFFIMFLLGVYQTPEALISAAVLAGASLPLLICTIFAYKYMIDLRPSGFGWGIAHLILSAVFWTVGATLNMVPAYDSAGLGYVPYVVVFVLVYAGGWVLPNYLYFQKRRALFRAYAPSELAYALGQWHSLS